MEQYPTISKVIHNTPIFAYDKLDGSNVRMEWNPKKGFTKYGSRHQLIDEAHPMLGESIELFNNKYADDLDRIFRKQQFMRATAFLEFHGPHSFAGFHENETHDVTLFDVHVYKKGFIPPVEFNKLFADVDTPNILYYGKANNDFVETVKNGSLPGMTFEGVVCKGGLDNRRRVIAFKVKNKAWLDKLKNKYKDDEVMFNKLA